MHDLSSAYVHFALLLPQTISGESLGEVARCASHASGCEIDIASEDLADGQPLMPLQRRLQVSINAARNVSVLPPVRRVSAAGQPGSSASGRRPTRCPRAARRGRTDLKRRSDRREKDGRSAHPAGLSPEICMKSEDQSKPLQSGQCKPVKLYHICHRRQSSLRFRRTLARLCLCLPILQQNPSISTPHPPLPLCSLTCQTMRLSSARKRSGLPAPRSGHRHLKRTLSAVRT